MMGRYSRNAAYGHRIQHVSGDVYRISWTVDRYYSGDRLRHPIGYSRITDERGARRFAKRHNLQAPALRTEQDQSHG